VVVRAVPDALEPSLAGAPDAEDPPLAGGVLLDPAEPDAPGLADGAFPDPEASEAPGAAVCVLAPGVTVVPGGHSGLLGLGVTP
jgi:hypothetical protein